MLAVDAGLLTEIFAVNICAHQKDDGLLPGVRRSCKRRSRGTEDQLLMVKTVLRGASMFEYV